MGPLSRRDRDAAPPAAHTVPQARPPLPTELRRRLGDVLLTRGVLSPQQLERALGLQQSAPAARRRLGQVIVDAGLASERQVADALGELLGLDVVDLSRVTVPQEVARLLPRSIAEGARLLVLDRVEGGLLLAAADPTNVVALDDVRVHTGARNLQVVVALESQVRSHLARVWSLAEDGDSHDLVAGGAPEAPEPRPERAAVDDAPTVRLVDRILTDAVRLGASDIHVEPQRDGLQVRYRVDGRLRSALTGPRSLTAGVVSRLKIMSGMDIAERRVPQDGRTRVTVDATAVDARVSSLPSLHGEKVVVRLLDRADRVPRLEAIGLDPAQLAVLQEALAEPQGLVLITGPTGSGKTSTLYSALARVVTPEANVVTLEDPIEIQMPGITQVQVNERSGLTFGKGLRAILRQDPDVVLVGEVRDAETTELALRAAMTGHLVLTTLHTNSAAAAPSRLIDMGAEPFLLASSLTCAVAQRLARRPCPSCVTSYSPDPLTLQALGLGTADLEGATPRRGAGCADCGGTGYRGRTGVFEVLPVTPEVRSLLMSEPDETALRPLARRLGARSLRDSAVALARQGITTFEEALRVTPRDG